MPKFIDYILERDMKNLMKHWPLKYEINEFGNFVKKSRAEFKENEGFSLLKISTPILDTFD